MIIGSVIDYGNCRTSETDVNRAYIIQCCLHCRTCLYVIGRTHYHHSGNGTHECKVFVALMGCTVFSYGNTCMGCSNLYIQMRVTYGVTNLFKSTACRKHGKGTCKGNLSYCCKTCCNSHHIAFCDTTVDKPVGICFLKNTGFGCCRKVRI